MKFLSRVLVILSILGGALAGAGFGGVLLGFELTAEPIPRRAVGDVPVSRFAFQGQPSEVGAEMARWSGFVGTLSAARALVVEASAQSMNLHRRMLDASRSLEVQPTAGLLWVEYASLGHRLGIKSNAMVRALEMASVTQRREASTMYWCSVLTLALWKDTDGVQRSRAVANLGELRARGWLGAEEKAIVARALSEKAAIERREISEHIVAKLSEPAVFLKELGL